MFKVQDFQEKKGRNVTGPKMSMLESRPESDVPVIRVPVDMVINAYLSYIKK